MYVLDYISVDSLAEIKKSFQIKCKKNILKLNSKIFSEWHALTRPWEEQSHGPFLLHKEEKACWPLSMKCWKDDLHMKSVLWAQGRTTVLGLWPSALCCLTTSQTHLNNTSTSPAGTTLTAHTSRGSETHHSHPQCKVCVPRHPTQ